jgi:hypothetical protein
MCIIVKRATSLIPMQGYSLIMTNYHYLFATVTCSRKVYAITEKAYWRSTDVTEWFDMDIALIQDVLWHKACHPVTMNLK